MRYDNIKVLTDSDTKIKYLRGVKYPSIDYDNNDIYVITNIGDRLDLLANEYYGNIDFYWMILVANNLPGDSIFVAPNLQLRIPVNTTKILQDFDLLNEI
jgi:hypothetical protein